VITRAGGVKRADGVEPVSARPRELNRYTRLWAHRQMTIVGAIRGDNALRRAATGACILALRELPW
jgi:hypothetical protein